MTIKASNENATKGWVLLAKATKHDEVGEILQKRMSSPEISGVFAQLKTRSPKEPTLRFRVIQKAAGFRVEEYRE